MSGTMRQIVTCFQIVTNVSQSSVLGLVLHFLFIVDLPTSRNVVNTSFAEDYDILTRHKDLNSATERLQSHFDNEYS